jgi:5-methylcytosine-specific restriction endonuclease McrBC regulatory subunit McrC
LADQVEITVKEHQKAEIAIVDEAFMRYAEAFLNERYTDQGVKWPISLDQTTQGWVVESSGCAGVISFNRTRLNLIPKVGANVFYMMLSLRRIRALQMDVDELIDIKEGDCFLEVLASLFLAELDHILERGLLKRYVRREENRTFLKGKLLVNENIRSNMGFKPRFYCSYHDLTYDNLENRIILRALNLVIPRVVLNTEMKKDLLVVQKRLLEEVELDTSIGPLDCNKVHLDRLSFHYENALMLSKIILEESFIRSTEKGRSKGFNFIVDMNMLFEDFLTEMTKQVLLERMPKYRVINQRGFKTLDRQGELTTVPDILIYDAVSHSFPILLDAKYKMGLANADAYQMIAYSLAIPSVRVACLVYPEKEWVKSRRLDIKRDLLDNKMLDLPLIIKKIDLSAKNEENYHDFVRRIKKELWTIIIELIDISRTFTRD